MKSYTATDVGMHGLSPNQSRYASTISCYLLVGLYCDPVADFLSINYFITNCQLFQCRTCYQSLLSINYRTKKLIVLREIKY